MDKINAQLLIEAYKEETGLDVLMIIEHGSCLRGYGKPESDHDMFVIYENDQFSARNSRFSSRTFIQGLNKQNFIDNKLRHFNLAIGMTDIFWCEDQAFIDDLAYTPEELVITFEYAMYWTWRKLKAQTKFDEEIIYTENEEGEKVASGTVMKKKTRLFTYIHGLVYYKMLDYIRQNMSLPHANYELWFDAMEPAHAEFCKSNWEIFKKDKFAMIERQPDLDVIFQQFENDPISVVVDEEEPSTEE